MAARRSSTLALAALAIGLSLLAGCTSADPNLQPTYSCTPDDGSSPYPCARVQYDAKAKEAALYAEAEAVYRKFFAEDERIHQVGGVTEPTPVLLETTTGLYLQYSMENYRSLHDLGSRLTSGAYQVAWIRRTPGQASGSAVVAMSSCLDGSQAVFTDRKGRTQPGVRVKETATFTRDGSMLKLANTHSEVVPQC